jgi:hypothetical protein
MDASPSNTLGYSFLFFPGVKYLPRTTAIKFFLGGERTNQLHSFLRR